MRLGNPQLAVDSVAESEGRWIEYPQIWWGAKPMRARVKGASTKEQQALFRELTKNLTEDQIKEQAESIAAVLVARRIIDIDGWYDCDGNELKYSRELIEAIFSNQDNRRALDYTDRQSRDLNTYNAVAREETEKNLPAS